MRDFLFDYNPIHPTTWSYLSSLLMIGLFFKFGRFWSVRNLDLVLLILLAPGLLFVHFGTSMRAPPADPGSVADVLPEGSTGLEPGDRATEPSPFGVSLLGNNRPGGAVRDGGAADTVPGQTPGRDAEGDAVVGVAAAGAPPASGAERVAESPPGVIRSSATLEWWGYLWLLGAAGLFLCRLLLDPTMVRRPLLEPNLSSGGLTFLGCSLFIFLMANVVSSPTTAEDLRGPMEAERLLHGVADREGTGMREHGPGNAILHLLPSLVTMPQQWSSAGTTRVDRYVYTAKTMAILSHLAVVTGIVAVGYRHFGNMQMGIGAATLYLMLPYTAQMTGRVNHVLPAALLVWAVLCYRRPLTSGLFIGFAIGVVYYPLFLLPLWISFYWQRGLTRFISGVAITVVVLAVSLIFVSSGVADYVECLRTMFGLRLPRTDGLTGIWGLGWDPIYRWPVIAAFVVMSVALALWPAQKNLGTLLSCSAAVMVATQFWHGDGGGLYAAWFMPLTLLTIFRPNLEDRVALTVLGHGPRRPPPSLTSAAA